MHFKSEYIQLKKTHIPVIQFITNGENMSTKINYTKKAFSDCMYNSQAYTLPPSTPTSMDYHTPSLRLANKNSMTAEERKEKARKRMELTRLQKSEEKKMEDKEKYMKRKELTRLEKPEEKKMEDKEQDMKRKQLTRSKETPEQPDERCQTSRSRMDQPD